VFGREIGVRGVSIWCWHYGLSSIGGRQKERKEFGKLKKREEMMVKKREEQEVKLVEE